MLTSSRLYIRRNSPLIKQIIYQKLRNSSGNTFSFSPHVCYFSYHPWIVASEGRSLITLFFCKMKGRKHSHKNINIPVPFYQSSVTPPLPSVEIIKKSEVDKKIQACETLTLTEGFVCSSYRCSKQSVSGLLALNWLEHSIR